MGKWASALGQGVAAVAKVGSEAIDTQMKLDATIAAEQRAADIKLATAERMMAIEEAMRNRAADRFTQLVQKKAGEQVPVETPSIEQTGLTRDSAVAPTDEQPGANFAQDPEQLAKLEQQLQAAAADPSRTEEQRQDARDALSALQAQKAKQKDVNAASVAGKTRDRTALEAARAAMEEAGTTDAAAFAAGTSLWKDAVNRDDKKTEAAAQAREKDADRASRERVAGMQTDARRDIAAAETARKTEADRQRAAAAQARTEALAGGKGPKATALMQNYEFMTTKLGKSQEEAEKLLFQAKDSSEAEKVFKLLQADKFGDLTVEAAFEKVRGIASAGKEPAAPAAGAPKRLKFNPATGNIE